MRQTRFAVILLILLSASLGCLDESSPSPTLALADIQNGPLSRTPSPTVSPSSTSLASSTPTLIAATARLLPTASQTATSIVLPSSTGTEPPRQLGPLQSREPTLTEVSDYLLSVASEDFPIRAPLSESASMLSEDVNGDGLNDLIVTDYLRVAVLLWQDDHYIHAFAIDRLPPWKYNPSSRVRLMDWTADGVPEIVFDLNEDTGGTGIVHNSWVRYIIHCQQESCNIVWTGTLASITSDYNGGGMDLYTADLNLVAVPMSPTLRYISSYFSIYSYGIYLPHAELRNLTAYTSTLTTYYWNGSTFMSEGSQIISLPQISTGQFQHETTNEFGNEATVKVTSVEAVTNQNDRCELHLDGQALGEVFGCKSNFVTVEWKDITGDNRDDIVVVALSGTTDPELAIDIDASCVHQRFLAYDWDGDQASEIADVYGCVVQSDLFGVRLQDFDLDGQRDLVAARWSHSDDCEVRHSEIIHYPLYCYLELQYDLWIYKWNGERFVYWDSVAGDVLSD